MDKTIITRWPVTIEQRFRTPSPMERKLGLWVDRIGQMAGTHTQPALRYLGQYAAVAISGGAGRFVSPSMGQCELNAGDVIVLFPDEPTSYFSETGWDERWIVWNGPLAASLEQLGPLRPDACILRGCASMVVNAHDALTPILTDESLAGAVERQSIVLSLIAQLTRFVADAPADSTDAELRRIIDAISRQPLRPWSTSQLAARMHISEVHFRRIFRRQMGTSPQRFIAQLRMTLAKSLLARGHAIKNVAARLGYDDVLYFMRVFRQITGQPPGEFQKSALRRR